MSRTENRFLKNKGYLLKKLQYEIFDQITAYMKANKLNQTILAERLNVSKGYVSQIMNADFDHKLSKLVDLAISIDKVPSITFEDVATYEVKSTFDEPKIVFNREISEHKSDNEPTITSSSTKVFKLEPKQYNSATGGR